MLDFSFSSNSGHPHTFTEKRKMMMKKPHWVVFRTPRGYQRQLHSPRPRPALWPQIACWPAHLSLEANSRTRAGARGCPSCPNLSPRGTPRTGTLPSEMLDSWNMVSKAWWISAKEGRSQGLHCQPGHTRPRSGHPGGLANKHAASNPHGKV